MISILIPVGNRRDDLKVCLESCNSQLYPHETIVSVMGDTQGCAELAQCMGAVVYDLRYLNQQRFNKAMALNFAGQLAKGDRLLLLDADCSFAEPTALNKIVGVVEREARTAAPASLRSFGTWGTMLCTRGLFASVNGFDETLGDIWAPDDLDFAARVLTIGMPASYTYFAPWGTMKFRAEPDPVDGWVTSMQRPKKGATNPAWIVNRGAQRRHRPKAGPFYARIGGHHGSPADDLLATVRYFQKQRATK